METVSNTALTHESNQGTYGKIITPKDLEKHHEELSKYFRKFLYFYPNQKGKEVYTDMNSCAVEINNSSDSLSLKIYGRADRVLKLREDLKKMKLNWFIVKSSFSKFHSGKEIDAAELLENTYKDEITRSGWFNGLMKYHLEKEYR